MIGPVLNLELMLGSRRSRAYIFRWLYAGLLIVEILGLVLFYGIELIEHSFQGQAEHFYLVPYISERFVTFFVTQQMILLVLATPVLTASAVTEEKTTGTLQYLFTTHLGSWDIIMGKLLARLLQLAMLVLTGFPLLAFLGGLGYLEPFTAFAVLLVTVMPMVALGAASLLASVWFKQTRDAVLALFIGGTALFLLVSWGSAKLGVTPLSYLDPHYLLEPVWTGLGGNALPEFGTRLLGSASVWGGITVLSLTMSVALLRPIYIRQLEGGGSKRSQWWRFERAPIGENPVTWKERHVEGLAPVRALKQIPTWLAFTAIFLATTALGLLILYFDLIDRSAFITQDRLGQALSALGEFDLPALAAAVNPAEATGEMTKRFVLMCLITLLLAALVVGIRCSGTITGERERKTWEPLLLTPLETKKIIHGKLWGIMGASYLYLLAFVAPALALAPLGGISCLVNTAILAGVIWLGMYFVGSAGVWCSVRSKGSWRSLLGTLGLGYLGGGLAYGVTTPILFIVALVIMGLLTLALMKFDEYFGTSTAQSFGGGLGLFFQGFLLASYVALAVLFFLLSWYFVYDATKWVADRERTRHWQDEPRYSRSRRPVRRSSVRSQDYS